MAIKVCAAVIFPVSEYKAKHAVCSTQNTNIPAWSSAYVCPKREVKRIVPIVDAMNSGRRPILSHSRPAIMAMMKL